jgi:hypothetical protein
LLHRAQEVIPYLDDAHSQVVRDLVRAVMESTNHHGAACGDLEAELQSTATSSDGEGRCLTRGGTSSKSVKEGVA